MAAASGLCEQKGSGRGSKGGLPARPYAGNPGGARRIPNPGANPVQRMMTMSPEQRERVLEKLPPAQQANIRQRLENFDKLPPAEKNRQLQMLNAYNSLPAEKQELLNRQLRAFNSVPDDRRKVLLKEMAQLRQLPDSERQARLNSEDSKSKFSPSELQMLSDISENYPFPGK